MTRPLVAIPSQIEAYDDVQAVKTRYISYLENAGASTVIVPVTNDFDDVKKIFDAADGILLTGGNDISSALYGWSDAVPTVRDKFELKVAKHAFENNIPTFGICRGLQMMNVALGGSLTDCSAVETDEVVEHWQMKKATEHVHGLRTTDGGQIASIIGEKNLEVNSIHRQVIWNLGSGFAMGAASSDGFLEAAYAPRKKFYLGVQWHPEFTPEDAASVALVNAFIGALQ